MPYINDDEFKEAVFSAFLALGPIKTPGRLAYLVQQIMLDYYHEKPGFTQWAAMRGAIEDQVDEFRRRVIAPYEDQKAKENGDVFTD